MRRVFTLLNGVFIYFSGTFPLYAQPQEFPYSPLAMRTFAYGSDPMQRIDFWPAVSSVPAPLVILVHGGGLRQGDKLEAVGRWKAQHYPQEGYGFASANYRLVPRATVEQACQDIADAIKALVEKSVENGIDRQRIVLIGHGGGGNLVGLIATDEQYLKRADLSFGDIAGIVGIDSALYDVPARMRDGGSAQMHEMYRQAFGTDLVRQRLLSPAHQAVRGFSVRNVLLMYIEGLPSEYQAQAFATALTVGGTQVEILGFPGGPGLDRHDEIIQRLGDPTYAPTQSVDIWLKKIFDK